MDDGRVLTVKKLNLRPTEKTVLSPRLRKTNSSGQLEKSEPEGRISTVKSHIQEEEEINEQV